jgi:spermidine synthase
MKSKTLNKREFLEQITPTMYISYRIKKIIFSGKSKYHKIDIIDTYDRGICFCLDNQVQSSTQDEWIYHESLVHPIMFTHPNPKRILIIGGGEGAVLREVLKHSTVKRVIMVEIDKKVIDVSKKFLVSIHKNSFFDKRVELIIDDGYHYLKKSKKKFDCIIVDASDPGKNSPSNHLYTIEFYSLLKSRLRKDGIFVTQATSPFFNPRIYALISSTCRKIFPVIRNYFYGCGFVVGSLEYDPLNISKSLIKKRIKERYVITRFYDENTHSILFNLPKHIKEEIKNTTEILTSTKINYLFL